MLFFATVTAAYTRRDQSSVTSMNGVLTSFGFSLAKVFFLSLGAIKVDAFRLSASRLGCVVSADVLDASTTAWRVTRT